ncbi:MAG: sulfurtransferase [Cyclobacteriaceae bacterium]
MKKLFTLFFFAFTAIIASAQHPVLVTAQWLNEHKSDPNLVVLQVSFMKYEYDQTHIPGAQFLWPESLAPNSPYGSYNAPDIKKATEVVRGFGINNDSHIVIYYVRNELPAAARMFLTLEHFGLGGKVSMLNGGMDAWKKDGFATNAEVPAVKKGNVKLTAGNLLVDKEYVLKTLKSDNAKVVDARLQRFYDGEPTGNPRDGHIAGAGNIPYTELMDASNMLKADAELEKYFQPVASKDKELVAYCFIGQTASVVYLAGRELGYSMKLYDGSMQEWSRLENLPMETTKK